MSGFGKTQLGASECITPWYQALDFDTSAQFRWNQNGALGSYFDAFS